MQATRRYLTLLSVCIASAAASTGDLPKLEFIHHDWELACDNTRTCRAAGYSKDGVNPPVSVLLTRKAGPGEPVSVQLQLGHYDEELKDVPASIEMFVNEVSAGKVTLDPKTATGMLTLAQTKTLLSALLKASEIEWRIGMEPWSLSTDGANAVLLKMDEFQGRLGTTTALIRKGKKSDTAVLPPLPVPSVTAAAAPATTGQVHVMSAEQRKLLIEELRKTVMPDSCEEFAEVVKGEAELSIHRLSANNLLVSARCWTAPYNRGDTYWMSRLTPPFVPLIVASDATGYVNGTISAKHKGRGLGDCADNREWTWDGTQFIASAAGSTGMCRFIAPGGAWHLPTLVTRVIKPK